LAKYTTGSSASDTARVAKWGLEVSTSGTMFGKAYQTTIVEDGKAEATVQSNHNASFAQNVVAPGTKNDTGIQIKIAGTPEVEFTLNAQITEAAKDIFLAKNKYGVMVATKVNAATDFAAEKVYYKDGDNYKSADLTYYLANATATYYKLTDEANVTATYYPIAWTASVSVNDTYFPQDPPFETLEKALNALVTGINGYAATVNAGATTFNPNTTVNLVYTLTWAWAFDGNNAADTILGNLMGRDMGTFGNAIVKFNNAGTYYEPVAAGDYSLNVGCGFSVTATQVA